MLSKRTFDKLMNGRSRRGSPPPPVKAFRDFILCLLSGSERSAFAQLIILLIQWLCKQCRRKRVESETLLDMEEGLANLLLKALGQRIRALRTEQGYSQEAFADKCGVHRTFMGTIERGESNLSFQNILKVAITLGVSLSTLFLDLEEKAEALPHVTAAFKSSNRPRESKRAFKTT